MTQWRPNQRQLWDFAGVLRKQAFSLSARLMKLLETKLGVVGNHLCYQLGRSCLENESDTEEGRAGRDKKDWGEGGASEGLMTALSL